MEKQDFISWVSKIQATYRPNREVLSRLSNLQLVAFVGPTGVGKTTVIEASKIAYVKSDVTRTPRNHEKNGREYYFRTDYLDILKEIKLGLYAQYVVNTNNEFYGTRIESYPQTGTCAMSVIAKVLPELRQLGFSKVTPIYILPPSYVEWMRRIGSARSDDLRARLNEARESLPIALNDNSYQFVLNDTISNAVSDVHTIISGQEISSHRARLAKQTAELLIGRLGDEDF